MCVEPWLPKKHGVLLKTSVHNAQLLILLGPARFVQEERALSWHLVVWSVQQSEMIRAHAPVAL